jgi:uncharacterized membrane protein YedE/YeeE
MNDFWRAMLEPWPWYVAGPAIGLTVPLLLILGNKNFGVSSSLRHLCAICIPAGIPFFQYDWKREAWNLFFVSGILIGGWIAWFYLSTGAAVSVDANLQSELSRYGIVRYDKLYPVEIFNFTTLLSLKGFIMIVIGGFLVGFGTRYAGGCTSGHSITGISMLQLPSVIATICFMAGGIFFANFVLPFILRP